jgi:hypothetical protein
LAARSPEADPAHGQHVRLLSYEHGCRGTPAPEPAALNSAAHDQRPRHSLALLLSGTSPRPAQRDCLGKAELASNGLRTKSPGQPRFLATRAKHPPTAFGLALAARRRPRPTTRFSLRRQMEDALRGLNQHQHQRCTHLENDHPARIPTPGLSSVWWPTAELGRGARPTWLDRLNQTLASHN